MTLIELILCPVIRLIFCFFMLAGSGDPLAAQWARSILAFAALMIVPYACFFCLPPGKKNPDPLESWAIGIVLFAGFFVGYALMIPSGRTAAWAAAPWLVGCALGALASARHILKNPALPLPQLCIQIGIIYLLIGAIWLMFDRSGIRPLDFSPDIVLLTAVHFHYAGFALLVLVGLAARQIGGRFAGAVCIAVIAGVPLTALGITATQWQLGHWIETFAACWMAAAGFGTAVLYLKLVFARENGLPARIFWLIAAVSLIFSMTLAAMYGLRYLMPVPWLSIPWMRALHGSANAFGFALCGLLGWYFKDGKEASRTPSCCPKAEAANQPR